MKEKTKKNQLLVQAAKAVTIALESVIHFHSILLNCDYQYFTFA